MTRVALLLASLILFKAPAFAFDHSGQQPSEWARTDGVVQLEGPISSHSDGRFRSLFLEALLDTPLAEPIVVELNSHGGNLRAAFEIVSMIEAARRENTRVVTLVKAGGRCFSACILVFASGDERRAAPDALFLFHGFRNREKPGSTTNDTAAIAAYLAVIAAADADLAGFLQDASILDDDLEIALPASQLRETFLDFVTAFD